VLIILYILYIVTMTGPIAYPTPAPHAHQSYQPQQRERRNGLKQSQARRTRNHARCKTKTNPTTFTDGHTQTALLQSCLEAQGNQPSKQDDDFRLKVVNDLEVLLNRWVTSIRPFQNKNHLSAPSNKKWARPKVCLLPFGSYRLGVHRKDADLDCLCLAPPASSRGEFFTSLIKLLKEDDRVQEVHAISSAYTPVIKFLFQGLHMDLLFARLEDGTKLAHHQSFMDGRRMEYAIDDADLMGLDEASVRSLNGARVAQSLLTMVPNVDTFRMTLRAVKEWALVHGLYSNVLGFLGGVNFAILVALICKRQDKNATPAALLKAFFSTFANWKWPMPVTLVPNSYQPPQGGTFNGCYIVLVNMRLTNPTSF
jgi:poly(A) polymerase